MDPEIVSKGNNFWIFDNNGDYLANIQSRNKTGRLSLRLGSSIDQSTKPIVFINKTFNDKPIITGKADEKVEIVLKHKNKVIGTTTSAENGEWRLVENHSKYEHTK